MRWPRISLLVADPPWKFGDNLPGPARGAANHYPVLTLDQIKSHWLPPLADDAMLLLWRVSSMVEEANAVVRAWGFTPKSEIVWVKTRSQGAKLHFGMGRYVRAAHESCVVAVRGKAAARVLRHDVRSVMLADVQAHSQKPAEFFALAESLFPGPRAELFARTRRPGWHQHGEQLGFLAA